MTPDKLNKRTLARPSIPSKSWPPLPTESAADVREGQGGKALPTPTRRLPGGRPGTARSRAGLRLMAEAAERRFIPPVGAGDPAKALKGLIDAAGRGDNIRV
jgi:hypothetical protein